MKNIALTYRALLASLLTIALIGSASDSQPSSAGPDQKTSGVSASAELESRVRALENRVVELDSIVKTLDGRVLELEAALLRRRLDAPDKLHFYREADNLLDRLQDEVDRNEYTNLAGVGSSSGTVLAAIPVDPIEPTPPPAPGPKPIKVVLPLPENPVELQVLSNAVDSLPEGPDPRVKALAISTLAKAGDHGLAVLIAHGLYNDVPSIRARSAEMLGTLGGKHVIRELIEAFYASAVPTVPPYQREYVKMLRDQVSNVTGQDFFFYIRRTARAPEVAEEMVKWWDANWQTVPRQLGEPELDTNSPYYFEELATLRALKLNKRAFGNTNYSDYPRVDPGEVTRDVDQPFRKTIPVLPRDSINSKPGPAGRDDPKLLRDEHSREHDRVP